MTPGPLGHGHHPGTVKDGGSALAHSYKPGTLRHDGHATASPDQPQVPIPNAWNAVLIGTDPSAGPVLYEFRNGQREIHLTYPAKRFFYAVKDLILIQDLERQWAEQLYPRLKDPDENEVSLVSVLLMLLSGSEEKYRCGLQIVSIEAVGRKGVNLKPMLVLDKETLLPLEEEPRWWSESELDQEFRTRRIMAPTEALADLIEKLLSGGMTMVVTGGAGALEKFVATEAGEIALAFGWRKLVRLALKKFVKVGAKCSFAFFRGALVAYWKEAAAEKQKLALRSRLDEKAGPSANEQPPQALLEKAVVAGIATMIDAFIDEWWKDPIMKPLNKAFEEVLKMGSGREIVRRFLIKESRSLQPRLVKILSAVLLDTFRESIATTGSPDFDKMAEKLREVAGRKIIDAVVDWLKEIAGGTAKSAVSDAVPALR